MKNHQLLIAFAIFFSLIISAVFGFQAPHVQADEPPPTPGPFTVPDFSNGPLVAKIYFTEQSQLNEISAWTEPWDVNKAQGYAVVEIHTLFEYNRLQQTGVTVEINTKLSARYNQPNQNLGGQKAGIPGYPCYRTVEETFSAAQAIANNYPNLAQWLDIGDSWEKITPGGNPGYDMMVLKLTNSAISGPKPKLFVMSSIHAREYTPAELNARFAEYLIENYGLDADVTWLLDYHEVHLLLQSNPDGRKQAETGFSWRKNTNENYCSPASNNRGADLNRNFEFQWGCCNGSSGSQCDSTYRGPSRASEPETQAVQDYVRSIFPDQRDDDLSAPAPIASTGVFLDIHSYGELVLWPWGFTATPAPNSAALQTLGRKFAFFNGYTPEQSVGLYPTDGTTDDFGYGELGLPAYTFELGTSFFQPCGAFENTILPNNLPTLIYAAKVARTPYLSPAGPDTLNISLSQGGANPGQAVTLTASINDSRYNNSNGAEPIQAISRAVYYIDTPHWITATPVITFELAPADGTFNSPVEAVNAVIDTSSLSAGRHTIFVRGQDSAGNWGPPGATFLYITQPGVSPVIEGYIQSVSGSEPLSATVSAGIFQAQSNQTTGYYSMTVVSDTYNLSALSSGYAISTATGIPAQNFQTIRQDFQLYPACNIFSDDVEGGNPGWTAQSPWAISAENANSPTHSWTDSPGSNYGNNRNISLTSPSLDLSGYSSLNLSFSHIYDLEDGYDYGYVESSINGGINWTTLATYNGEGQDTVWKNETINLDALSGESNVKIRFRLKTDGGVTADGWHIDDIVISGGGAGCLTEFPPVAEFSTDSPVVLGNPVQFNNLSTGSPAPVFSWDMGDGLGSSTAINPSYTYAGAGTFTVTLVASNSLGIDSTSRAVTVLLPPTYTLTVTVVGSGTVEHNPLQSGSGSFQPWESIYEEGTAVTLTATAQSGWQFDGWQGAFNGLDNPIVLLMDSNKSITATFAPSETITYGVSLTAPVRTQSGAPGNVLTYTIYLSNTGSIYDSFSLHSSFSGTLTLPALIGPLPPYSQTHFTTALGLPANALNGEAFSATVIAASQGDSAVTASLVLTGTARIEAPPNMVYLPLILK